MPPILAAGLSIEITGTNGLLLRLE